MQPGVYPGLPMGEYHAIDAASSSRLRALRFDSPAHLRAAADGDEEARAWQVVGDALHTAVLEPDAFSSRYTLAEQCAAVTKKGERCSNDGTRLRDGAWFCGVKGHDPVPDLPHLVGAMTVLSPKDWTDVQGMRDSLFYWPHTRMVLDAVDDTEVTVVWVDEETGVLCKARIDAPVEDLGATVEVKTTQCAGLTKFTKDIYNLGYYNQGAWYLDAAHAAGWDGLYRHIIVAAEKRGPLYAPNGFVIRDDAIKAGREENRDLLRKYAQCVQSNHWPLWSHEYREEFIETSLPPWAWRQIDERLAVEVAV